MEINFHEIRFNNRTFPFKKMHFNVSSAKWRQFCLSHNQFIYCEPSTKPLLGLMLTYNKWGRLAYGWGLFHRNCSRYNLQRRVSLLQFLNTAASPRGQWVNPGSGSCPVAGIQWTSYPVPLGVVHSGNFSRWGIIVSGCGDSLLYQTYMYMYICRLNVFSWHTDWKICIFCYHACSTRDINLIIIRVTNQTNYCQVQVLMHSSKP